MKRSNQISTSRRTYDLARAEAKTPPTPLIDLSDPAQIRKLVLDRAALLEALQPFANIGEYRELVDAMAATLRPHERAGFIAAFKTARATIAKANQS